jgi:predicted TIM-barrel fold metal-dependent hydrolase
LAVDLQINAVIPILDSHIHLFDPNRPQGTPVLVPGSPTSKTGSFPAAYRRWAEPLGVIGAIHVEASNWVEDNLWALQIANADNFMVGVVGNLDPEKSEFEMFLERFHRDPMFRGIRYGNIWGYDLVRGSTNPDVIARLRRLPESGLVMDTASPGIDLLKAVIRLNDAIPELIIVVDHLPSFDPDQDFEASYQQLLQEMSMRPTIHAKLSEIIHRHDGTVSTRVADHRRSLDRIVDAFGEDRILFGSDYPTSDMVTTPEQVFRVVREYLASRPREFQEKVLFRNAWRVYGCRARTDAQRKLLMA